MRKAVVRTKELIYICKNASREEVKQRPVYLHLDAGRPSYAILDYIFGYNRDRKALLMSKLKAEVSGKCETYKIRAHKTLLSHLRELKQNKVTITPAPGGLRIAGLSVRADKTNPSIPIFVEGARKRKLRLEYNGETGMISFIPSWDRNVRINTKWYDEDPEDLLSIRKKFADKTEIVIERGTDMSGNTARTRGAGAPIPPTTTTEAPEVPTAPAAPGVPAAAPYVPPGTPPPASQTPPAAAPTAPAATTPTAPPSSAPQSGVPVAPPPAAQLPKDPEQEETAESEEASSGPVTEEAPTEEVVTEEAPVEEAESSEEESNDEAGAPPVEIRQRPKKYCLSDNQIAAVGKKKGYVLVDFSEMFDYETPVTKIEAILNEALQNASDVDFTEPDREQERQPSKAELYEQAAELIAQANAMPDEVTIDDDELAALREKAARYDNMMAASGIK